MRIRVGSGFFVFGVYLALGGYRYVDFSVLPAVLIHETGHIFAAALTKTKISGIYLEPFGAKIEISEALVSYGREALVAVSGPVASLAAAFLTTACVGEWNSFALCSFFLGILNLFPLEAFDGGRILHSSLAVIFGIRVADSVLRGVSFLVLFFMWLISVYLLLCYRTGLSLFAVSVAVFLRLLMH